MSIESAVTQVVSSYITAMHGWEIEAERIGGHGDGTAGDCGSVMDRVQRMEQMFATGEMEVLESARQRILAEHCTPRKRISRAAWGTTPKHHPTQEHITKIQQISESEAHVWTDYSDKHGFQTRRRYELELSGGVWLIDQHYVLRERDEYPEIS
jgi:hypothetical protein